MNIHYYTFLLSIISGDITNVEMALEAGIDPGAAGDRLTVKQKQKLTDLTGLHYCKKLTALHIAVKIGKIEIVAKLLEKHPSLISSVDYLGHTPLFFSNPCCIPLLLKKGADIHHKNNLSMTPLLDMALECNAAGIKIILDHASTPDPAILSDLHPYFRKEIVSIIHDYYNEEVFKLVNAKSRVDLTPLGYAIPIDKTKSAKTSRKINRIVTMLIHANASVNFNYKNRNSISFLEEALNSGFLNPQTRKLLLDTAKKQLNNSPKDVS